MGVGLSWHLQLRNCRATNQIGKCSSHCQVLSETSHFVEDFWLTIASPSESEAEVTDSRAIVSTLRISQSRELSKSLSSTNHGWINRLLLPRSLVPVFAFKSPSEVSRVTDERPSGVPTAILRGSESEFMAFQSQLDSASCELSHSQSHRRSRANTPGDSLPRS